MLMWEEWHLNGTVYKTVERSLERDRFKPYMYVARVNCFCLVFYSLAPPRYTLMGTSINLTVRETYVVSLKGPH